MKSLIYLLTLFCVSLSFAQSKEFKITGTLYSSDENLPLEAATVHLETIKDSTLVTYSLLKQMVRSY